jgi:hypothetical protein
MNSSKTAKSLFAAIAVVGLLGLASPATAAAPSAQSVITPVKTAVSPSCVDVVKQGRSWGFPYVEVKNNCSTTQRVKIVWAYAPDSSCKIIKPGKTVRHSTGGLGKFDGLRKC